MATPFSFGASAIRKRPEDPYAQQPVAPAIGAVQPQPLANPNAMAPQQDNLALIQALSALVNPDPLGSVARSNSRPMGLTSEADWRAMFPQQPAAPTMQPSTPFGALPDLVQQPPVDPRRRRTV
jgi:hypothetical protein